MNYKSKILLLVYDFTRQNTRELYTILSMIIYFHGVIVCSSDGPDGFCSRTRDLYVVRFGGRMPHTHIILLLLHSYRSVVAAAMNDCITVETVSLFLSLFNDI